MCCYESEKRTKAFWRKHKDAKHFYGYKRIYLDNQAICGDYTYKPGWNVAIENRSNKIWNGMYSTMYPSGIHVYIQKPKGVGNTKLIKVKCWLKDVVLVGSGIPSYATNRYDLTQVVLKKVFVYKKDLEQKC